VNVLGKGRNVYMAGVPDGDASRSWPRPGTMLGIGYGFGFNALQRVLTSTGRADLLGPAGLVGIAAVAIVTALLPARAVFRSPSRQPYSPRVAGVLRLAFFTLLMVGLGHLRVATGGKSVLYISLLWVVPMTTTFMFFMLLRDVYQHANADDGRRRARGSSSPTRSPAGPCSSTARTCTSRTTCSRRSPTTTCPGSTGS